MDNATLQHQIGQSYRDRFSGSDWDMAMSLCFCYDKEEPPEFNRNLIKLNSSHKNAAVLDGEVWSDLNLRVTIVLQVLPQSPRSRKANQIFCALNRLGEKITFDQHDKDNTDRSSYFLNLATVFNKQYINADTRNSLARLFYHKSLIHSGRCSSHKALSSSEAEKSILDIHRSLDSVLRLLGHSWEGLYTPLLALLGTQSNLQGSLSLLKRSRFQQSHRSPGIFPGLH